MEDTRGGLAAKLVAIATAVALVATMAIGTTTAQALQNGGQTAPGSITVHKYKTHTASNTPGTGADSQALPYGAEPMGNVQFTLYQLDTAKVEGADPGVDALTAAPVDDVDTFLTKYQLASTSGIVKTTDTNGEATWGNLPFAYYLLVETNTGTDTVNKAVPSIITLPYAQQAAGGATTYVKDVHVYPKNVSNELVEKAVTNQPDVVKPGDTLNYTITFSVPTAGNVYVSDTQYMTGSVVDTLPTNAAGQPTITVGDPDGNTVWAITEGGVSTQLAGPIGFDNTSATNAQVTWTLTPQIAEQVEQLNKTTPADPVSKVQIRVATTVNDNAFSAGVAADGQPSISNTAKVNVQDKDGVAVINGSESTTDPITTPGFEFTKVDSNGAAITDGTATFKLAASYDDATSGNFLRNNGVDLAATTNTTSGKAVFSGLNAGLTIGTAATPYTAVADAVTAAQANPGTDQPVELWLVETQAPNGYRILQAPQKVTLSIKKATADAMVTTTVVDGPLSIVNTHNGETGNGNFALPNTGGTGALIFIVAGIVLVGIAVTYFVRSRKRAKNERP